jgi:two-component system, CitB family, sensor histidine kinase MalK
MVAWNAILVLDERGIVVDWRKRFEKQKWSLQTTITVLVCMVVILALLVTDILITMKMTKGAEQTLAEKATDIARIVAKNPIVVEELSKEKGEVKIQAVAEEIRRTTHVEFIVVMDMGGIRKSHPNIDRVGEHFVGGDEGAVLKGKEKISIAKGTLGMSLRSFTPVFDDQNKQIGAVAVGISLDKVNNAVAQSRKIVYISLIFGLLVGVLGALFLAKKIKKILFDLEPIEIAKLLEERSAMLHSTKEGIVAVDSKGYITLVNNEAIRLFQKAGLQDKQIGKKIEDYMPSTKMALTSAIEAGRQQTDQEQELNGITLLVNKAPVIVKEKMVGEIFTFRDKTEIKHLAEQLTGVKMYAEALRAQSHEFMNKLHVILGLIQMENYQALSSYIEKIVDHQQTELEFVIERFKDPVLAGFILGKLSFARESGAEFIINGEGIIPEPDNSDTIHEVITILGNLIDNGLEAVKASSRKSLSLRFDYYEGLLVLEVHDTGKGIDDDIMKKIFTKGFSTKGQDRGFGLYLVKQSLEKLTGEMEIISNQGEGTTFIVTIPYREKGDHIRD